ncbi:hypothetical protein Aduo_006312 [Ancylostoma duodenale]
MFLTWLYLFVFFAPSVSFITLRVELHSSKCENGLAPPESTLRVTHIFVYIYDHHGRVIRKRFMRTPEQIVYGTYGSYSWSYDSRLEWFDFDAGTQKLGIVLLVERIGEQRKSENPSYFQTFVKFNSSQFEPGTGSDFVEFYNDSPFRPGVTNFYINNKLA